MLVFIPSLGAYVTPALLGGGKTPDDGQSHPDAVRPVAELAVRWCAVEIILLAVMMISLVVFALHRNRRARLLQETRA